MLIWIIPVIFRHYMQKAIRDQSTLQKQPVISVISCSVTAHISRCLRLNGEIVRGAEKENRNLFLHIRWKTQWVFFETLSDVHTIKLSNLLKESRFVLWMRDISWDQAVLKSGLPKMIRKRKSYFPETSEILISL